MAEAIRELISVKGYSEDAVKKIIEDALKAAYKKTYGTDENAIVVFEDDLSDVYIYSRKTVVDGVYDPVTEIELEDALAEGADCEIGDQIDMPEDPKTFERKAVSTGRQAAHQGLTESLKKSLENEYKDKIGQMIIGYYQRERNGNIYVDLGKSGKLEGYLPLKFQSPAERYEKNDRIKALIVDIKSTKTGVQIVLSRNDPELVRSILTLEVPEIDDGIIEIHKIVREAGYRTKIVVSSKREDVDPVGACVGLKGVRIQNVIRELENEKIDVLRYDPDPAVFIKNSLSPAQVERVIILDAEKRQALAIVEESQLSIAIGKGGLNVRLANRLCDWNIDVKTEAQAAEMDLSSVAVVQNARNIFADEDSSDYDEDAATVETIPEVDVRVAALLKEAGIVTIEQFIDAYYNGSIKEIVGITEKEIETVNNLIKENFDVVDESKSHDETAEEEEEYFCPECGAKITLDMTQCPKCGVEFEFKEDEE